MERFFGSIAAVMGALGVAAGAFGAHFLKARVEPRLVEVWHTAASYHLWHAIALLFVALMMGRTETPSTAYQVAGWGFLVGTLVFSGSLYVLVASGRTWLGAVTPIGGMTLIVAWFALARALWP